ncbi:MAG: hypothetical protein ORN98_06815 [Alphaproteobacteria bacterium]|nr:hypothetical protein [Alphaproteobacteria bacterium]
MTTHTSKAKLGRPKRAQKSDNKPLTEKTTPSPIKTKPSRAASKKSPKTPLKEMAQTHTGLALETLAEVAARGNDEKTRLAAAEALLDRAWGKPQAQNADTRSDKNAAPAPVVVRVDTGIRRDAPKTKDKRRVSTKTNRSRDDDQHDNGSQDSDA